MGRSSATPYSMVTPTTWKTSHMSALNSTKGMQNKESRFDLNGFLDKNTFHKCVSQSEKMNCDRNRVFFMWPFGPHHRTVFLCVYCRCGFSSQTEILHSSVLFHAHCFLPVFILLLHCSVFSSSFYSTLKRLFNTSYFIATSL